MEAAKLHQCHKTSTPGAPVRTCHGQPESVPAPSPGQRAGIQAAGVVGQDVKQGALGALVGQDDAPPQAAQGTCSEIRREWGGGRGSINSRRYVYVREGPDAGWEGSQEGWTAVCPYPLCYCCCQPAPAASQCCKGALIEWYAQHADHKWTHNGSGQTAPAPLPALVLG